MHASFSHRVVSARTTRVIVATLIAVAALAGAGALLSPPPRNAWASSAGPQAAAAAIVPVGIAGESAVVVGDPSVPSAASVFLGRSVPPEAQPDTF